MLDHVTIVNLMFRWAWPRSIGLCSRSFLAALVAGIFVGLIHAGLVVLVGLQAGSLTLTELPYLKDGVDMAMETWRRSRPPHLRQCALRRLSGRSGRRASPDCHRGLARPHPVRADGAQLPAHRSRLALQLQETSMVEFTLPKNSKVTEGKTWPGKSGRDPYARISRLSLESG